MTAYGTSFALGGGYSGYQVQYSIDKVKQMKNDGVFTVNRTFLPVKVFYVLFMGSMVSFVPFSPVYMEQLGLNSFQIGIIRAISPVCTTMACPLWGLLMDKYSIHKGAVLVGTIVGTSAMGATYFTPPALNATDNTSDFTTTSEPPLDWHSTAVTFSVMASLSLVAISFFAHVNPTINSNVMRLLKDHPQTDYGKQRLWGAAGWGSFSAITGLSMDIYSRHYPNGNRFLPAYIIFATMMLLAIVPIFIMRFPPHQRPASISRGLLGILTPNVLVFLSVAITVGISMGVIQSFLFIFLKSIKAPSVVMGLTLTFTCLSEIPFMYVSGRMIIWFGEEAIFAVAVLCYALRFLLYSLLKNPWTVLPIELLHGICFGALYPAMTSFANKISPPGMEASVQNIMASAFQGIGIGLGTIAGGYIYDHYGPRRLFVYCSILSVTMATFFIVFTVSRKLLARQRRRHAVTYDEI